MPILTTRCVVLKTHRYSDTSKILRLMTREKGPVSALARGALRPRSPISGLVEPFAEGEATIYMKRNRDLQTLSSFELLRERQGLGIDLERFAGASVLCELVLRFAPEQRDDRLYDGLTRGLDALLDAPVDRLASTSLATIWDLVRTLGFAPELDRCLECGRDLGAEEDTRWDPGAGGLRCGSCPGGGVALGGVEVAELRHLVGGDSGPLTTAGRQRAVLRDFIRIHPAEGLPLRSLEYLGFE
ncbi:MAG: DNA repair protein RecO [Gemmatimonadota bacterium]